MNYKKDYGGKASAIITEAYVFPNFKLGELPKLKFYTPVAAWDTGADHTSISAEVIEALQLTPKNYTTIMVFGGEQRVGVYEVTIALPNGKLFYNMEVYGAELDEYSVLFGMDIITETDFLITRSAQRDALLAKNKDEKTTFQFFASKAA